MIPPQTAFAPIDSSKSTSAMRVPRRAWVSGMVAVIISTSSAGAGAR
jgi:hypothetical protein